MSFEITIPALVLVCFVVLLFLAVTVLTVATSMWDDDSLGLAGLFLIAFYAILWGVPTLLATAIWAIWWRVPA